MNHYPRLVGEQSGANIKVILRAMGETLALWWRMRFYPVPEGLTGEDTGTGAALTRQISGLSKPFPSLNLFAVLGIVAVFAVWRWTRRG